MCQKNYNLDSHEGFNTFKKYGNLLYNFVQKFIDAKPDRLSFDAFMVTLQKTTESLVDKQHYTHDMTLIIPEGTNEVEKEEIEKNYWQNVKNKVKGDIFEILVMFTLQYFHNVAKHKGIVEGTYMQIPDDEDAGVDFIGTVEHNGKRAFGQIKFRNPLNPKLDETNPDTAFNRTTINKLAGEAINSYDFDRGEEYLILVTNIDANKAIYYRAQQAWHYVDGKFDLKHDYIKIIDRSSFNDLISRDNYAFWNTFLNMIGK